MKIDLVLLYPSQMKRVSRVPGKNNKGFLHISSELTCFEYLYLELVDLLASVSFSCVLACVSSCGGQDGRIWQNFARILCI